MELGCTIAESCTLFELKFFCAKIANLVFVVGASEVILAASVLSCLSFLFPMASYKKLFLFF